MVDNKPRSLQWLIINSASRTGSHADRFLRKGWGGGAQPAIVYQRENVVSPGNEIPNQYSRVIRRNASNTNIVKAINLRVDNIMA